MKLLGLDYRIELETFSTLNQKAAKRPKILIEFQSDKKSEFVYFHFNELAHFIENLKEHSSQLKKIQTDQSLFK
jgi:hypothetical protein